MKNQTASAIRGAILVVVTLLTAAALLLTAGKFQPSKVQAQTTLGGPLAGLTTGQLNAFNLGDMQFSVQWDPVKGLGPVYTTRIARFVTPTPWPAVPASLRRPCARPSSGH